MARRPDYPFEPRSTAYLIPGQFWGVPLSNGRFACGRVVGLSASDDPIFPPGPRVFLAGLMDWDGPEPPTPDSIAGAALLASGFAHVKTIQMHGQLILGWRSLDEDRIAGLTRLSHRAGGTVYLYQGATRLRPATPDEQRHLPVLSTWGLKVIHRLAERCLVQRLPLPGMPVGSAEL
jgi:hypothetical protein